LAGTAVDIIGAGDVHRERVFAGAAEQTVGTARAGNHIVAAAAFDRVVGPVARQKIGDIAAADVLDPDIAIAGRIAAVELRVREIDIDAAGRLVRRPVDAGPAVENVSAGAAD
jgi:hypothetical protein